MGEGSRDCRRNGVAERRGDQATNPYLLLLLMVFGKDRKHIGTRQFALDLVRSNVLSDGMGVPAGKDQLDSVVTSKSQG